MPTQKIENTDVLIVGAGPSGLMMACQLAVHGISFQIIEKREKRTVHSGALILQARSLEILEQMGIVAEAINQGIIVNKIQNFFNGKKSSELEINNIGKGYSAFPFLLMLEQSKTEQLLTDFLTSKGHQVKNNTELINFSYENEKINSSIQLAENQAETIHSKYLIGADGAHSSIRQKLKIPFIGKSYQLSLFVTDCKANTSILNDEVCFSFSKKAIAGLFPLKKNRWRIDGAFSQRTIENNKLTFEEVKNNFSKKTKLKVKLEHPEWFSVFQSHQRYAQSFQSANCFLIGDSAHIHSPIGAQGMNTGLQDAFNLAWKLAFVIKGYAKTGLLNTYSEERQAVARKVIRSTDLIFRIMTSTKTIISQFRLLVFPLILKSLFLAIRKSDWIRVYFFKHISETGIHYQKRSLSRKSSTDKFYSNLVKAGDRLPYILFKQEGVIVNLQKKISNRHFQLFLFISKTSTIELSHELEKYSNIVKHSFIYFSNETEVLFKKLGIKYEGFILVRPDMYIACRSDNLNMQLFAEYFEKSFIHPLKI